MRCSALACLQEDRRPLFFLIDKWIPQLISGSIILCAQCEFSLKLFSPKFFSLQLLSANKRSISAWSLAAAAWLASVTDKFSAAKKLNSFSHYLAIPAQSVLTEQCNRGCFILYCFIIIIYYDNYSLQSIRKLGFRCARIAFDRLEASRVDCLGDRNSEDGNSIRICAKTYRVKLPL